MKKLSVVISAMLCCSLAYSQEVDVRLIPRVDVNVGAPTAKGEDWSFDLGNTCFYTLVEGSFLDNFSFSIENHWMSMYDVDTHGDDVAALYRQTGLSYANNWLDWAYLTYTFNTDNAGSFSITGGKDVLAIGGFEYDAYDFDSHFGLNSQFWNYAPVYQWGGKIGYTTPSEMTSIFFQVATSPFGANIFKKQPQYPAYSLLARGEYDWFAAIWSTNFLQYDKSKYINIISLGNQFYAGDCTIGIDWMNRARTAKSFFNQEMSLMGTVSYNFGDKFEVFGKAGWERFANDGFFSRGEDDVFGIYEDNADPIIDAMTEEVLGYERLSKDYIFGGIGMNWYPLRDSQDLRVHAVVSANNWYPSVSVNIGVTYNFSLTDLFL